MTSLSTMPFKFYLLICLFCFFSVSSWAATSQSDRLEEVQSKIKDLAKEVNKTKLNKAQLYKQLKKQSQKASKLNRELHNLKAAITEQNKTLVSLKEQQKKQQKAQAKQGKALAKQLRAAYINGQPSYLKVLLNQNDPAALSRTSTYFRYFHQAREKQLISINNSLNIITEQQTQLLAAQQQQKMLLEQRRQQQIELDKNKQQRLLTLKQLDKKLTAQEQYIISLREEEQSLQALLESLSKKSTPPAKLPKTNYASFKSLKGSLTWPIKGKVIARYGHSRNIGKLTWQGIMINAPIGKKVVASASGRVVFSDWLRGFGLLTIIDHGHKYMTLYGNNQTLLKEVGENVRTGELIALSGNQGIRQSAGLYFELRHKGKPTNPSRWLAKH